MKRDKKSNPVYHTAQWYKLCGLVRSRQKGMCADCMRQFEMGSSQRPNRVQMVHHIIPVEERPDLVYDLDNLEGLCYSCHEKRHNRHTGQTRNAPVPGMRVVKV